MKRLFQKNIKPADYNKNQNPQAVKYSNVKTLKFLDRTFNIDKEYAINIFDFIIKNHNKNQVFQFEITGELLSPDIINFLNDNAPKGLFRFEIGIQSTHEETNKLVKRYQNWDKLSHNIKLIQSKKIIPLHLDLIAGLPNETYELFQKTFNLRNKFYHEINNNLNSKFTIIILLNLIKYNLKSD